MNNIEEIIKVALLGTEKYQSQLQDELADIGSKIEQADSDREAIFLKQATTTLLYEEAGQIPITIEEELPTCPEENKPTISAKNAQVLKTILATKDYVLFDYFIYQCQNQGLIVLPSLIPQLLEKAHTSYEQQSAALAICGEAGKWLCQLNPQWKKLLNKDTSVIDWETGSFEARKQHILNLRKTSPTVAIKLLEDAFPQESANNRYEFVLLLKHGLSIEDQDFLQKLIANDRSKKVKSLAQEYIKQIPESVINQIYLEYLAEALIIEQDKKLFKKKTNLAFNEQISPSDEIFDSGIDKVSSMRKVKDHEYWISQMLAVVHPESLAEKLKIDAQELLKLLLAHKKMELLFPSLVKAACIHKHQDWAKELATHGLGNDIDLLDVIPEEERTTFYPSFVEHHLSKLLYYLLQKGYPEIERKLASNILYTLKVKPYQLQQPDYQRLALLFPQNISDTLKQLSEEESKDYQHKYFIGQLMEIRRIMEVKHQLIWK